MTVEDRVFTDIASQVFDLEVQGDDWPGRGIDFSAAPSGSTVGRHGLARSSVGTPFQPEGNDLSDVRTTGSVMTMPGFSGSDCLPAVSFRSSKIDAQGCSSRTTPCSPRRARSTCGAHPTSSCTTAPRS